MVCGEFHRRHPEAEIIIDMCDKISESTRGRVKEGKLDLIFWSDFNDDSFSKEPVCDDQYVIAMRKDLPGAEKLAELALTREEILSAEILDDMAIKDYSVFKNISFIRYGQRGSVWSHMYELMEQCRFSPCMVKNSMNFGRHYNLMLYGCGAVVTTKFLVSRRPEKSDELLYFPTNVHRQIMAFYRKNEPLSDYAREFIDITKELVNSNLIRL